MTDIQKQSMQLWYNYQNAKTKKQKDEALFELNEFKRKQAFGSQKEIPTVIDEALETFDGELE